MTPRFEWLPAGRRSQMRPVSHARFLSPVNHSTMAPAEPEDPAPPPGGPLVKLDDEPPWPPPPEPKDPDEPPVLDDLPDPRLPPLPPVTAPPDPRFDPAGPDFRPPYPGTPRRPLRFGGGLSLPPTPVNEIDFPVDVCFPNDIRIDQNVSATNLSPGRPGNDPDNIDLSATPEDNQSQDDRRTLTEPPALARAGTTSAHGFAMYPELSVKGIVLNRCEWRQVFFENTLFERWDLNGDPASSPAVQKTEKGKFSTPRSKGEVDWGPKAANERVRDSWTLQTNRWVRLKVYLRDQVARKGNNFRNIIICRDFTIEWDNLGGRSAPPQQNAPEGRKDFNAAKGALRLTIGPLRYLGECPVR